MYTNQADFSEGKTCCTIVIVFNSSFKIPRSLNTHISIRPHITAHNVTAAYPHKHSQFGPNLPWFRQIITIVVSRSNKADPDDAIINYNFYSAVLPITISRPTATRYENLKTCKMDYTLQPHITKYISKHVLLS